MPHGAKGAKRAKAKAEGKLPVAHMSRKNEDSRNRHLEKRLAEALEREAEALEQQTATAEILRVISRSPTDVQPVFAAVLTSAARLCDAFDAVILQVDGDRLRIVAHEGPIPTTPVGALPLRGTAAGRAVLDRRTIHVPDLQAEVDEYPESSVIARLYGGRTALNVPLLRGAEAIGAIAIRRTEVRPFTDRQVELLETFAAQAAIAIENVRLFNETKEALEQQTATSEILRVISSSPADLPRSSMRWPERRTPLRSGQRRRVRLEGAVLRPWLCAGRGRARTSAQPGRPIAAGRDRVARRSTVPDLAAAQDEFPEGATVIGQTRSRAILVSPDPAQGRAGRRHPRSPGEPGPFTDSRSAPRDVRQPGRHRHRERPAVQDSRHEPRADRGARAADGHERDPAGDLELADRRPAGLRSDRPERGPALRGGQRHRCLASMGRDPRGGRARFTPEPSAANRRVFPRPPGRGAVVPGRS